MGGAPLVSGVLWGFLGHGWGLLLSFLTTPYILRQLGDSLFGIYALSGFVLSYFAFLEFGLGAAATKYIAQHLAENDEPRVAASFWACLLWYLAAGLLCLLLVGGLAGTLVEQPLRIAVPLQRAAAGAIRLSALLFCFSLCTGLTSGTLRALGRFPTVTLTTMVAVTAQTGTMIGALLAGYSLLHAMAGLCLAQAGLFLWQLIHCFRVLPGLRRLRTNRAALGRLLRYGGTLTVAALTGPLLSHLEKVFMTRLTSVGLLTYYAVPFALVERLALIPSAFGAVLFPSYSYYDVKAPELNRELHYRGTLYILAAYGVFAAFLVMLGRPLLAAWLGEEFASRSASVLPILAAGGLLNAAARPAVTALQGIGKPHIPVALHLAESAIYVPFAYQMVQAFGMTGAAWAWCVRVAVDAVALHVASASVLGERGRSYGAMLRSAALPLAFGFSAFGLLRLTAVPLTSPLLATGVLAALAGYGALVWRKTLDQRTRDRICATTWLSGRLGAKRGEA
jgi:O-antigen/teichoic acid export membrane protein